MTIGLLEQIQRDVSVISSGMDQDLVMISIQTGKYYGINPVGRRIWELLETPTCVAELCEKLGQEFEVSNEQCEQEVLEFVSELSKQKLLLGVKS